MRRKLALLAALAVAALAAGCAESGAGADAGDVAERKVRVTTTTNIITDLARQIGGDRVEVEGLMGPGVDPHLYKASAGDVGRLGEADLVLYGGLELEGKMGDVLAELGERKPTVAVTRDMPQSELRGEPNFAGRYDPHVWFDVRLWTYAARTAAEALSDLDPRHRATYERNLKRYVRRLEALDAYARERFSTVPPRRRVLVTSHDAFHYLGARYQLDVVAIQGVSTATEATTADVERVAQIIAERGVKAVFVESSVPPQTIEAVLASARRQGGVARVGGELFSDAAGDDGTPEGTYEGMVRHNVDTIVEGLR